MKQPSDCWKVVGLPVLPELGFPSPVYALSTSQFYAEALGSTMGRTGLCSVCDAAIYRRETTGSIVFLPRNLSGPYYHAVEKGLVELPCFTASYPDAPSRLPAMSEEAIPFLQELLRSERGLDYAEDLKRGVPWKEVWARLQARYGPNNPDLLHTFVEILPKS